MNTNEVAVKTPIKSTFLWLFFVGSVATLSAYELKVATINKKNIIVLQGDFGKDCKQCEVIVDYGSGFKYAYRPKKWHPNKLSVVVKDLGKSLNIVIKIRTATNMTKPQKITISPNLISSTVDKKHLHTKSHQDPFGGKGTDIIKISSKEPTCNHKKEVFHHAQILILKKRFGNARIERIPTSACLKCKPLKIRWYHEPTGYISYQIQIQRREIEGVCRKSIRR